MHRKLLIICLALLPVVVVIAAVPRAIATDDEEMVTHTLELPKTCFLCDSHGTPVPNMEETPNSLKEGRPTTFEAPRDVSNVALSKPVTASSEPIIGSLDLVNNGSKEAQESEFLETGGGDLDWVQIDLEKEYELWALAIWHYFICLHVYHDVIVVVSNDPTFSSGVSFLYNNDIDNSAGLGVGKDKAYVETNRGRLIDAKRVKARYVRSYTKGSNYNKFNHHTEIEVYGRLSK